MAEGKAKVKASSLNVRKGAGTNYAKIGSLANGTTVSYSGETNGWLKINYNGKTGYISKNYTTITSAASGSDTSSKPSGGASSENVNIDVDAAVAYNNKRGYSGSLWKQIQSKVGTTVDGDPGPKTAKAIAVWQKKNGLAVDGKCGPGTLQKMGLKSDSGSGGGDIGPSEGATGSGKINGHTKNYKQYASPWGPKMYSNHNDKKQTYANSACGPTAVASVIACKADSSVTPYTLGTWAVKKGYRTYNSGTSHSFVGAACSKYGLSCKKTSVDEGCKALANGKYAVAVMGPGYWTKGGHYITPYGYKDGTIYVDDPGHSSRPNGFKQGKSAFKSQCNGFWVIG